MQRKTLAVMLILTGSELGVSRLTLKEQSMTHEIEKLIFEYKMEVR